MGINRDNLSKHNCQSGYAEFRRKHPRLEYTNKKDFQSLMDHLGGGFPEVWETIVQVVFLAVREHPKTAALDEKSRIDLSIFIFGTILATIGGSQPYFPACIDYFNRKKQIDAFAKFDGTNIQELAVSVGVSTRHLYRVFQEMKEENQRPLPKT